MDHDMLVNKNIVYEEDTLNYKFTDSFKLLHLKESESMVKNTGKNKKLYDDLPPIDIATLKEMQTYLHESSEDVASLVIHNDNDFKLKTKEKSNTTQMNNNISKRMHTDQTKNIKCMGKDDNLTRKETIEVKCTNKVLEHNRYETLRFNNNHKDDKDDKLSVHCDDFSSTNNFKNDLKSLLIMMAVTNDCNASNNSADNAINYVELPSNETNENEDQGLKIIRLVRHNRCEDMSEVLRVMPINIPNDDKSSLLRKYCNKWMSYVKKRREVANQRHRQNTINIFFDKLEKRKVSLNQPLEPIYKAKIQARDYNTYQHRYKAQKHIIALQKAKLDQQNRLIEELKYNKIIDASRHSLDNMKEEVRQNYSEIDKHLKPKIKCLTNELKIREIEEPSLVLHCLKVPQFLQRMEERAREREEKHAMIRERRKQMEEERIRLKQQAELAKAEMDKEEKIRIIKELREKRRRDKVENIRKKQHAERIRALFVMAELHYEKSLMIKFGLRPFKLLMKIKLDNIEKAKAHYQFQIKKNLFLNWMWYTEDMWYERNFKAEDLYRKKILRKTFDCIKMNHHEFELKMQVAEDYYDLLVTQSVFRKFQEGIDILKKEREIKLKNAVIYYERSLPALNALKREQDARKLKWREKVLQVVPDYTPPED